MRLIDLLFMRINAIFTTLLFSCFLSNAAIVLGQINADEEYEMLIAEVALFQKYANVENSSALLDSAKLYATGGQYSIASVFLEQLLEQFKKNNITQNNVLPSPINLPDNKYELIIKSGIDFNRQEFEIGYTQTDSVLVDEMQKPFIGIQYSYLLTGTEDNGLKLASDLRYDKENFNGAFDLEGMFRGKNSYGFLQLGLTFDRNDPYPDLSYFESNGKQLFNWTLHPNWRLQIDNTLRYKTYKNPSISVPDFVKNVFNLNILYNDFTLKNLQFYYGADYNESIDYDNNDYFEQDFSINTDNWFFDFVENSVQIGFRHNRFAYDLQDSLINNKSRNFYSNIKTQTPIQRTLKWNLGYQFDYKNYVKKSEQDADYYYHILNTSFKKNVTENISVEAGYLYENKKHITFKGCEIGYLKEQDYNGNGALVGLDYSDLGNYFISINVSYTWRRYPNAEEDNSLSIYSNRNVLSLHALIQIPLSKHINLSAFAFYDNDKDLDNDINDTQSAIFSAEIQYAF